MGVTPSIALTLLSANFALSRVKNIGTKSPYKLLNVGAIERSSAKIIDGGNGDGAGVIYLLFSLYL